MQLTFSWRPKFRYQNFTWPKAAKKVWVILDTRTPHCRSVLLWIQRQHVLWILRRFLFLFIFFKFFYTLIEEWFCCGFTMISLFFSFLLPLFLFCCGSQKGPRPQLKALATHSLKTSELTCLMTWPGIVASHTTDLPRPFTQLMAAGFLSVQKFPLKLIISSMGKNSWSLFNDFSVPCRRNKYLKMIRS